MRCIHLLAFLGLLGWTGCEVFLPDVGREGQPCATDQNLCEEGLTCIGGKCGAVVGAPSIDRFVFAKASNPGLAADATGTISGTGIALTVPFGTVVTAFKPTITITGKSVSPASGVAQNFTETVVYTDRGGWHRQGVHRDRHCWPKLQLDFYPRWVVSDGIDGLLERAACAHGQRADLRDGEDGGDRGAVLGVHAGERVQQSEHGKWLQQGSERQGQPSRELRELEPGGCVLHVGRGEVAERGGVGVRGEEWRSKYHLSLGKPGAKLHVRIAN